MCTVDLPAWSSGGLSLNWSSLWCCGCVKFMLVLFSSSQTFRFYFSTCHAILYLYSEGRMHDARMLTVSNLYDELENFARFSPTGAEMCLYGDPAYPLRVHLQAPFRIGTLTRDMEICNDSMTAVRVSWVPRPILLASSRLQLLIQTSKPARRL